VVAPSAFEDEQQPRRLGRYDLIRRIAVGGMAEIYLARSEGIEGFEKLVVLKRILPQYAESQDFVTMFIDEARLVAGLSHPNIAQVYDIGLDDSGSYFFAMEFVDGEDVRQIIRACAKRGERLPVAQAVAVGVGIAAGLHAAHERRGPDGRLLGIVHRDVSPSNVLVTYDGCVKLVDFGIAKAAGRQSVTRTGVLKGKCAYMSPEQTRGDSLDRRSDVFAIGILLYELTVGHRPFRGDNEYATMRAIVSSEPTRPTQLQSGYPKELERIIFRALAKNTDERYPSARALQVELERYARQADMDISPVALADFMQATFADKLRPPEKVEPGQSVQLSRVLRGLTAGEHGSAKANDASAPPETRQGPVTETMPPRQVSPSPSAPLNLTHVSLQLPRQPSVFSVTDELADTPTQVISRGRIPAPITDPVLIAAAQAKPAQSHTRTVIVAGLAALFLLGGAALAGHIARRPAPEAQNVNSEARGAELPSPAALAGPSSAAPGSGASESGSGGEARDLGGGASAAFAPATEAAPPAPSAATAGPGVASEGSGTPGAMAPATVASAPKKPRSKPKRTPALGSASGTGAATQAPGAGSASVAAPASPAAAEGSGDGAAVKPLGPGENAASAPPAAEKPPTTPVAAEKPGGDKTPDKLPQPSPTERPSPPVNKSATPTPPAAQDKPAPAPAPKPRESASDPSQ
jgi:serine/threonine protein kinase